MTKQTDLSFIDKIDELKAMPAVAMELISMLNNPDAPISEVASKIKKDEAISAFVLKCCNSTHYGAKNYITTISQGLIMLGFSRYKSILMSYLLRHLYKKVKKKYIACYLWEHSFCVALIARELAIHANMKKDKVEEVYIAGLLHDIGKLALYFSAPEAYETLIQAADKDRQPILPIEEKNYGYNHSAVGFHLLSRWRLPGQLTAPAFFHHTPDEFQEKDMIVKLVTFANTVTHAEIGKRKILTEGEIDDYGLTKPEYDNLIEKIFVTLTESGLPHLE